MTGEITTDRLIINGEFEGTCHAERIEILSQGCVSGTVYSDNLSIEPGGKFTGITNPSEKMLSKYQSPDLDGSNLDSSDSTPSGIDHSNFDDSDIHDSDIDNKVTLISNESR